MAWDGGVHAFVLGTLVASPARHHGIGTALIAGHPAAGMTGRPPRPAYLAGMLVA